MYYIYGISGSSLLIESTDSMMYASLSLHSLALFLLGYSAPHKAVLQLITLLPPGL